MGKKIPVVRKSKPKKAPSFELETERRYAYAKALFDVQDEPTQDVILRLVERMFSMTGQNSTPYETRQKNFLWNAVRICVTLARMDIQVANFTPLGRHCIDCGTEVRATRPKRKVVKKRALS